MVALAEFERSQLLAGFCFSTQLFNFKSARFKKLNADVICVHSSCSWAKLIGLIALRLVNWHTPILLQEHHYCRGFMTHQVRSPWRFKMMLKCSYLVANRVLAVSREQASWMLECRLLSADKLILTGQARDVSAFAHVPSSRTNLDSPIRLLAYGRFAFQKGFDLLIDAMAMLQDLPIELDIAGDGELSQQLRAQSKNLPQIRFIGCQADIPTLLINYDAVVIPSRWEPFGLTCIESVAAKKLVFCSQVDGLIDQKRMFSDACIEPIDELTAVGIAETIRNYFDAEQRDICGSQALRPLSSLQESATGVRKGFTSKSPNESLELNLEWRQEWQRVMARWQAVLAQVTQ